MQRLENFRLLSLTQIVALPFYGINYDLTTVTEYPCLSSQIYLFGTTEISATLGFFLDSFTHCFDMGPCHYSSAHIDPPLPFLRSSV